MCRRMDPNKAKDLYEILRYQTENLVQGDHQMYLTTYDMLCRTHDADPGKSFCKVRLAKYFWGRYYMKCDDFIRAESAFLDALHAVAPTETFYLLPDVKIKYGLMLLYHHENRTAALWTVTQELVRVIAGTEYGCGLNQKEAFTVFAIYNENVSYDVRYIEFLKLMVLNLYRDVQKDVSFISDFYE